MTPNDDDELPEEIFEDPPANERDMLIRLVERLDQVSKQARLAAADASLPEQSLRQLLEDIGLDAACDLIEARNLLDEEKPGPSPN